MVQWLRVLALTAGGMGLISGPGTKIPHASRHGQKKKKKRMIMVTTQQQMLLQGSQGARRWAACLAQEVPALPTRG